MQAVLSQANDQTVVVEMLELGVLRLLRRVCFSLTESEVRRVEVNS
eukprot:SAG11_NODE_35717_length_265_cov_0.861446_2_plen_45_part_01